MLDSLKKKNKERKTLLQIVTTGLGGHYVYVDAQADSITDGKVTVLTQALLQNVKMNKDRLQNVEVSNG